jgi:hypothetical protein
MQHASRWRRAADPLHLSEWGLGGRGFGSFISWFLLGGDICTAYTGRSRRSPAEPVIAPAKCVR